MEALDPYHHCFDYWTAKADQGMKYEVKDLISVPVEVTAKPGTRIGVKGHVSEENRITGETPTKLFGAWID